MECFNCGSLPRRASRTLKQLRFDLCGSCEEATLLPTRETGQYVRGHLPGARSRPADYTACWNLRTMEISKHWAFPGTNPKLAIVNE